MSGENKHHLFCRFIKNNAAMLTVKSNVSLDDIGNSDKDVTYEDECHSSKESLKVQTLDLKNDIIVSATKLLNTVHPVITSDSIA